MLPGEEGVADVDQTIPRIPDSQPGHQCDRQRDAANRDPAGGPGASLVGLGAVDIDHLRLGVAAVPERGDAKGERGAEPDEPTVVGLAGPQGGNDAAGPRERDHAPRERERARGSAVVLGATLRDVGGKGVDDAHARSWSRARGPARSPGPSALTF